MTGSDLDQIDDLLATGEYHDDPYPIWETLRAADPVHWCEPWDAWLVTRYGDVETVLTDYERFSNVGRLPKSLESLPEGHRELVAPLLDHFDGGLQHLDPPEHSRIRRPISGAFSPATSRGLRDRVQEIVDEMFAQVIGSSEMDVVGDLAQPLPAKVLGEALGVPPEQCERFRQWDHDISEFYGIRTDKAHLSATARRTADDMVEWLNEITECRRRDPGPDVFTTLTECADASVIRDRAELHGTYLAILIGGHETTTGLIGTGLPPATYDGRSRTCFVCWSRCR